MATARSLRLITVVRLITVDKQMVKQMVKQLNKDLTVEGANTPINESQGDFFLMYSSKKGRFNSRAKFSIPLIKNRIGKGNVKGVFETG